MAAQDILLNSNYDLVIQDGDFLIGESDEQSMELLIRLAEGSLKQYPLQCVGIDEFSGSSGQTATLRNKIKIKGTSDGFINIVVYLAQDSDLNYNYNVTAERQ